MSRITYDMSVGKVRPEIGNPEHIAAVIDYERERGINRRAADPEGKKVYSATIAARFTVWSEDKNIEVRAGTEEEAYKKAREIASSMDFEPDCWSFDFERDEIEVTDLEYLREADDDEKH